MKVYTTGYVSKLCHVSQTTVNKWFDTGELACLQLAYENTPRGQDSGKFQRRHRDMTPAEKEEFARRLAELPEGDATLASAFGSG